MGNSLFSAAAALAYAYDHDLRFTMPHETPSKVWKALYLQHLVHPEFDPTLPKIIIEEQGFPFKPLPFNPAWAEDHIIVIDGYRQSERYFEHHREEVFKAFAFPWTPDDGFVAVHIRRGDYLIHTNKHPAVSKEWYLEQMAKFPAHLFMFFSDDIEWCKKTFGGDFKNHFDWAFPPKHPMRDQRPEVVDLVSMSCCDHLIGSASTFAVWAGILNRNPFAIKIIPKEWIKNGWQGTTAADWADVVPTGQNWERA